MDWQQLAERCENAEGPDRELDAEIEALFTDERGTRPLAFFQHEVANGYRRPCRFTASIDAALTLVPVGWGWSLYSDASIEIYRSPPPGEMPSTAIGLDASTPALALCAAALKAMNQGGE